MSIRADNRLDDLPMAPVTCRACGAQVLARKSSWAQTSVQWSAEAWATCPQRRDAAALAAHSRQAVFLSCSELAGSIVDAVCTGHLPIADDTAS